MGPSGITMFDVAERRELIELARRSIARGIDGRHLEMPVGAWSQAMHELRATFTTLKLGGELRGCCGSIEPRRSLVHDVWHSAWTSAYGDPRFWPVSVAEFDLLEITISVLTPLEPLVVRNEADLIRSVEPGVDGLVLRSGARQATFLPAVWEMLPDPVDFIEALKEKAGWAASYWPADMAVFRYRTETFDSSDCDALAA